MAPTIRESSMGVKKTLTEKQKLAAKRIKDRVANVLANAPVMLSRRYLKESQLAFIGSVAVESTYCEFSLQNIIIRLAGVTPEAGTALTHAMSFSSRLDVLVAIVHGQLFDPVLTKEFDQIVKELRDAIVERNTIIHGRWGPVTNYLSFLLMQEDNPRRTAQAVKAPKLGKTNSPTFPVAQLEVTANKLHDNRQALLKFVAKVWTPVKRDGCTILQLKTP
jgi:hypothetical protein